MKASSPSLTVAQATTNIPAFKDPEEVVKHRARLAVETISSFDIHTSNDRAPTTSYHSPVTAEAAYLSDVAARPTRKRNGIQPNIMCLVNDTNILAFSRITAMPLGLLRVV